ncbi:hypothetical protein [Mycobacterium sp.]
MLVILVSELVILICGTTQNMATIALATIARTPSTTPVMATSPLLA